MINLQMLQNVLKKKKLNYEIPHALVALGKVRGG